MNSADEAYGLLKCNIYTLDAATQKRVFISFRQLVYRDIYFLLHDHGLTEDVIQEAFMKAADKAYQIRDDSNLKAWLRKVARNTAYDMLRKNKKFRQAIQTSNVMMNEDMDQEAISPFNLEETVEGIVRNETLHEALKELKYEYRLVLFLYYIAGLSYAEIAQETGITEQVLTQRMARARKKLAAHFSDKWGDLHA